MRIQVKLLQLPFVAETSNGLEVLLTHNQLRSEVKLSYLIFMFFFTVFESIFYVFGMSIIHKDICCPKELVQKAIALCS